MTLLGGLILVQSQQNYYSSTLIAKDKKKIKTRDILIAFEYMYTVLVFY